MNIKRHLSILMIAIMTLSQPTVTILAATGDTQAAVQPSDPSATTPPADTTTPPADPATPPADAATPPVASTAPVVTPAAAAPVAPSAPTTGPDKPTGQPPAYAFNDSLRKWEPTIISSFSWDSSTGFWTSPLYSYDPVVGWYHVKVSTPSSAINSLTSGSADPAATLRSILGVADPSNSNTGPNSTNRSGLNTSNDLFATLVNNLALSNYGSQTSSSGDASINGNNNGGSASSGAATVVNNLLNLLNAMWSFASGDFMSFVHNINGDQTGDVSISIPTATTGGGGQLGALACPAITDQNQTTGPNSTNTATSTCDNNVAVRSQTNGSITNNLDLLAQSGNATVSGNTNGGNATSGNARAELNIINLINSAIGAGQTFFGLINIYGNLNGDILFPGLNLNGVVASDPGDGSVVGNSNTGPGSTNIAAATNSSNTTITDATNANCAVVEGERQNNGGCGIHNNIVADASSGNANISNNTSAGSATTGSASTNSGLFNIFNKGIFGDSAVLVIVNNMGHWIGKIMNLGGSGQSLGGLLTSNATVTNENTGPGSTNVASANNGSNTSIDNSVNGTITNNIRVGAHSGDAVVSGNTNAGNATTGDASVASNIVNIMGSHLSFGKVFGILFINVFGDWFGSVGTDTAAGTSQPVQVATVFVPLATSGSGNSAAGSPVGSASIAAGSGGAGPSAANQGVSSVTSSVNSAGPVKVLAAQSQKEAAAQAAATSTSLLIGMSVLLILLAGGAHSLERRYKRT